MTDTSPAAIAALLEGVTPGPWRATFDEATKIVAHDGSVAMLMHVNTKGRRDANQVGASARFIAAARELVPALSAERDRLAAQVVQLQRDLDAAKVRAERAEAALANGSDDQDCTDCEGSGITHQTERYCTCSAGIALSRTGETP